MTNIHVTQANERYGERVVPKSNCCWAIRTTEHDKGFREMSIEQQPIDKQVFGGLLSMVNTERPAPHQIKRRTIMLEQCSLNQGFLLPPGQGGTHRKISILTRSCHVLPCPAHAPFQEDYCVVTGYEQRTAPGGNEN